MWWIQKSRNARLKGREVCVCHDSLGFIVATCGANRSEVRITMREDAYNEMDNWDKTHPLTITMNVIRRAMKLPNARGRFHTERGWVTGKIRIPYKSTILDKHISELMTCECGWDMT